MTNTVSTLATADTLIATATGAGLTNKNTQLGKLTGYGELHSQGTISTWPASNSLPTPSNHGWIWDDSTLADGSASFSPGTWTTTIRLNLNANSVTADIHVRVYRRASNGIYNTIVLMVLN